MIATTVCVAPRVEKEVQNNVQIIFHVLGTKVDFYHYRYGKKESKKERGS